MKFKSTLIFLFIPIAAMADGFSEGMVFFEDIFIPQFLLFLVSIILHVIFVSKYSQTKKSTYYNLSLIPLLVIAAISIRDIQMLADFAGKEIFPWARHFDLMSFSFVIFFLLILVFAVYGIYKRIFKKRRKNDNSSR